MDYKYLIPGSFQNLKWLHSLWTGILKILSTRSHQLSNLLNEREKTNHY